MTHHGEHTKVAPDSFAGISPGSQNDVSMVISLKWYLYGISRIEFLEESFRKILDF